MHPRNKNGGIPCRNKCLNAPDFHQPTIFLNKELIIDRTGLTDAIRENDEIFVVQALSGG